MLHPAYIPPSDKRNDRTFLRLISQAVALIWLPTVFFYFPTNKKISLVHITLHRLCIKYIYVCMYLLVYVYACVYECTY